jgi:hypothetical protein
MPVHKEGSGYQYGHQKVYHGKNAKQKAAKQGRAIAISEARAAGHHIPKKHTRGLLASGASLDGPYVVARIVVPSV